MRTFPLVLVLLLAGCSDPGGGGPEGQANDGYSFEAVLEFEGRGPGRHRDAGWCSPPGVVEVDGEVTAGTLTIVWEDGQGEADQAVLGPGALDESFTTGFPGQWEAGVWAIEAVRSQGFDGSYRIGLLC